MGEPAGVAMRFGRPHPTAVAEMWMVGPDPVADRGETLAFRVSSADLFITKPLVTAALETVED